MSVVAGFMMKRDHAYADIPPNVVPNYVNPPSNGDYYIYGAGITLGVAGVLVIIRFMTVIGGQHEFPGAQEYLQLLALLFAIARYVIYVVDIDFHQLGHHIWDIPPTKMDDQLWGLPTIGNTMYPAGMICAKLAIILFYLRIFGQVHPKFRYVCYGLIAFDVSYLTAYLLMTIFWCQPLIATWHISYLKGAPYKCINGYEVDLAIGGLNLLTDLCILVLPLPIIRHLQLSLWRKVGVLAVFSVGAFAVATVIIREVIIQQKLNNEDADQSWAVIYEATWNSIELHVAIICGAGMALPQALRHFSHTRIGAPLRRIMPSTRGSTKARAYTKTNKSLADRFMGKSGPRSNGFTTATSSINDTLTKDDDIEMLTSPHQDVPPPQYTHEDEGEGKGHRRDNSIMQTTTISQKSESIGTAV